MKTIVKAGFVPLATVLAACAGSPPKTDVAQSEKPTYFDHVGAARLSSYQTKLRCEAADENAPVATLKAGADLANACVAAGKFGAVEKIGDRLAVAFSAAPWGPYFLALSAASRGDEARAEWLLDLALKKAPNEGVLHYEMGRLHWRAHRDQAAVAELRRASDSNAALFDAHFVTGQLALERGDWAEGRKYLERASAVEPSDLALLLTRAELESRAKDFARAETFLAEAVGHHPEALKARMALAGLQERRLKKNAEALAGLKQVKALGQERKLDSAPPGGLDDRIRALEKLVSLGANPGATTRRPSAEKVD